MSRGDEAYQEHLLELRKIAEKLAPEMLEIADLDQAEDKIYHILRSGLWLLKSRGSSWDPRRWIVDRAEQP